MASESVGSEHSDRATPFGWALVGLLVIAIVGIAGLLVSQFLLDETPGDRSVDAGFARDMSYHHAQAVEMSLIVFRRTDDPEIRMLAYDILTTQQAQIGMMSGWLNAWGLSSTGTDEPMTWMGHGMSGPMPGMATADEVASLETLPVGDMDKVFLQLMIRHHKGALDMAIAAAQNAEVDFVRAISRNMATGQQGEIDTMETMLAERQ